MERCSWPRLVEIIVRDLKFFKDWVDKNPDYLLVMSSDHGKNSRNPDFILHGESLGGNEGCICLMNSLTGKFCSCTTKFCSIIEAHSKALHIAF